MKVFQVVAWAFGAVVFLLLALIAAFWLFGPTVTFQSFTPVDVTILPIEELSVPDGFTITEYARVENARSIAIGPEGVLFIGSRGAGKVHAVFDDNNDMVADRVVLIDEGLFSPNGVQYRDGDLYVMEIDTLSVYPDILNNLESPQKEVLFDGYPSDRHHGWKFIRFGPDGLLYIPVGAPCNVCDEPLPYSTITRLDVDNLEAGMQLLRMA